MATTGGIVVSSTKTPQAVDDSIVTTEDLGIKINVLANDLGGVATSLYSIDQTGSLNIVRTSTTALGATIYITSDGQVYYDPTHASALQALTQGEQAVDSFVYEDRLGNGTISTARVYVTVTGTNDAPKANTDIASTKSDTVANIDVLANDVDPDHGAVLSIKSFDAVSASGAAISQTVDATGRVVIHYDPSRSATLQGLAEGQTATDTFTYSVTDEHGAVSTTTVTVTVTGVTPNSALTDPCFADEDPASFGALAIGTNGDDHLVGSSQGHTLVSGGTGDDDISVQAGGNHVCAGSGNDSVALNGNASNSEVDGEDGNDVIVAGAAGETGLTAPAADMVWSSTIDGGAGDDKILLVHAAHSTLLGGDGNDTIIVDSGGGDLIDAGAGHDFIMSLDFLSRADGGNNGAVTLEGGAGNDTIHRLAEGDGVFGSTLDGGDGNDDISIHEVNRGAAGTVAVNGGSGDDHVFIEYV
ncbi:MAG TPA: Ig-like domain-containing protein, partial [Beijerinckiaceae bacterium]